jgi:hypothetical protein
LQVSLEKIIGLLKEFAWQRKSDLQIILLGALALQYYGLEDRATADIDAEVKGDVEGLFNFLRSHNIPADLGENISGWSVIAMPPDYKERVIEIYRDEFLRISVLHPLDFIIAKLRRFTEEDIGDAVFVARRYKIGAKEIEKKSEEAIKNSPKDTALFIFRRNIAVFISKIAEGDS